RGLVVVAQAGVGGVEERGDALEIAGGERLDRAVHALVLGEYVPDAALERLRQPCRTLGVAQRGDAEALARGAAPGAALVVAARRCPGRGRPARTRRSPRGPSRAPRCARRRSGWP